MPATKVPNPFFGFINVGVLSQPTVQRGYLLRPYPHFASVSANFSGWGNSNYHALQSRIEKRTSHGLNITHRFVTSANYELPLGRGKPFGAGWSKWMDGMFGQWQINAILTLSSGLPLVFAVPQNTSYSFGGNQRPDATNIDADLGKSERTLDRWFDTRQFSQAKDYTFGTLGRTHPNIRSDGFEHVDFSVFKVFRIRERGRVEFRGEAFNLMNHPLFAQPGTTVNTPLFGVVSAQENPPRQVQLGLKIAF